MNKLFVSLELAKKLKDNHFKRLCIACYDKCDMLATYSSNVFEPKNYNDSGLVTSAPLYQQVIEWLRDLNLEVIAMKGENPTNYYPEIRDFNVKEIHSYKHEPKMWADDYYDALELGIEKALEMIFTLQHS